MKYVITWESSAAAASEELRARSLQVFSKWTPSEGTNFKEFVERVDGRGGFAVVETDDPALIHRDTAMFSPFFDFTVHPVLEIADATAIDMEVTQLLASIS
jgi:hypothetical protein